MATINRNGTTYIVDKAIRNGTEYNLGVITQEEFDALLEQYNELLVEYDAMGLFLQNSLTIPNFIYNSNGGVKFKSSVGDIMKPDMNTYYHYFWVCNPTTTAYDGWQLGVFCKTAANNPTYAGSSWTLQEYNPTANSVSINVASRMKIDGNDVKMSSLSIRQTDSNGWGISGGTVTSTFYCANATNTSTTLVELGTVDGYYGSTGPYPEEIMEAWEQSCGITEEESLSSLGVTTLSVERGSNSYYNLIAVLNGSSGTNSWVSKEEYDRVVALLEEETEIANIDVQYQSGSNYNWDGNSAEWRRNDTFSLLSDVNTQRHLDYSQVIRIDNGDKYLFGGFLPISGATKGSYLRSYVAPFEYFIIDKETSKITRGRGGVPNFSTYFGGTGSERVTGDCLIPRDGWIEYETEYRNYYGMYNWNSNYPDRNGNCYGYFYIKKDLSAMGYVSADDTGQFTRNQYGYVQTDYNTEWGGTYSRNYSDLFSDYNVNMIGPYNSSNLTYGGKLYTPSWWHMYSRASDDMYQYVIVYTAVKQS